MEEHIRLAAMLTIAAMCRKAGLPKPPLYSLEDEVYDTFTEMFDRVTRDWDKLSSAGREPVEGRPGARRPVQLSDEPQFPGEDSNSDS